MKPPILLVGAMEVETDFLIAKLENKKETNIAGYYFYEGLINSYPVVVLKTQVGTINASAATALAIQKYEPICIINQGTAGGYGKEIHTKDLVIGSEAFNVMSAKTPYKKENEGSDSTKWDYITFIAGGTDEKKLEEADKKLTAFFTEMANTYKKGKVHIGVIGSGDIWNREIDRTIYLNREHQVLCGEMEAIAVYTIANRYKIPVIGVKVISDNEWLGEPYDRNVGSLCQKFIYECVQKMIKEMKEK